MRRRAGKGVRKQAANRQRVGQGLGQRLLPVLESYLATKQAMYGIVQEAGFTVLQEFFQLEAENVVGPKGRHQRDRAFQHWGTTPSEFPFAGRRVSVPRPRVREVGGGEVRLDGIEALRNQDPLSEKVIEQILLGVSTRGYERSLERPAPSLRSRGASKSAASRHVVGETRKRVEALLVRRLDELDIAVLLVDGLCVAGQTLVIAMGISADGSKHILGLWQGSTENATICRELLQDLLGRGLRVTGQLLCIIDGGKGIRRALTDVFGSTALVQRCQVHKLRNLKDHLPGKRHAYVLAAMREAYASKTFAAARNRLRALVVWLERNGEESAAASLREGLDETLTVLKLDLPPQLRRSLATTNAIENLMSSIRKVSRNVKRWRDGSMMRRWVGLGLAHAEKRFRRIKGYFHLPALLRVLRAGTAATIDEIVSAA